MRGVIFSLGLLFVDFLNTYFKVGMKIDDMDTWWGLTMLLFISIDIFEVFKKGN